MSPARTLHRIALDAELQRDVDGVLYLVQVGQLTEPEATAKVGQLTDIWQTRVLLADYPGFRFFRVTLHDRTRWVAQAERLDVSPYALVSASVPEIRSALGSPA